MQVCFYQRKKRPNSNFSLEFIFHDVRTRLASQVKTKVRLAPFFSNGLFRRLWIAVDAWWHQGDVTHVTGDINFAAIFLNRKRTVLTVLDCGFLTRTTGFRQRLLRLFWLTLPVNAATIVTTISESAKAEIIHYLGYDPGMIEVVPVAVSDAFQPDPLQFSADMPRILQIGTAHNKNLVRAVQALRGIPCRFVVVGRLDDDLLRLAEECDVQLENHVNLSQEEIIQQYFRADLVLFASTYEGFGMPIVEAQRIGRPVVTSTVSSMPEVAGDGACLVDPLSVESIRAGILKVIQDTEYRSHIIECGFRNARRFDANAIAQQYLNVYRRLMAGA